MNNFKSLFLFNRRQQGGIFVLCIILILVVAFKYYQSTREPEKLVLENVSVYQDKIDSIKSIKARLKDTIYAFNPNYITDYRAYKLGLNEAELDRLVRFRESGQFINTSAQFQQVTKVSNQWLDSIAPFFKFPKWVNAPRISYSKDFKSRKVIARDINTASAEDIRKVYGIGPALSGRIIQQRERLNGFVDMSQVRDVYGLSDSTMIEVSKHFFITPRAGFAKIALNTATSDQLSSIPYFNDYLVDELIKQRTLREGFTSWQEVLLTSRFPQEKLPLIQLYLTID